MRKISLFGVLAALILALSQAAVAQPGPGSRSHFARPHINRPVARPAPPRHAVYPPRAVSRHGSQGYHRPPPHTRPHTRPANYRHYRFSDHRRNPYGDLRPGYTIPRHYRHRNFIINDWRSHRLYAPPPGYHWVQAGGDYLLVAIASNVIAQILVDAVLP